MELVNHTKEPWFVADHTQPVIAAYSGVGEERTQVLAARYKDGKGRAEADYDRAVICVNALAGIPTPAIETGAIQHLIEACHQNVRDYHDFMTSEENYPEYHHIAAKRLMDALNDLAGLGVG